MDTEIFYEQKTWAKAAVACSGCPIKLRCRYEWRFDPYAYAGGMTPGQRNAWRLRDTRAEAEKLYRPKAQAGGREKVTPEKTAEILAVFDSEMIGSKGIADRVGLAKSTVQRILRVHNRSRTPEEQRELSRLGGLSGGAKARGDQHRMMVAKLHAEGYTPQEIADLAGITRQHVYRLKVELELSVPQGTTSAKILALTSEGLTAPEVAEKLHVSRSLVHQVRSNARKVEA